MVYTADNGTERLYLNGELLIENNDAPTLGHSTQQLYLGNEDQFSYPFKGVLDGIHIYNKVLTEAEINDLYTENGWSGNETGTVTDYDGNTYNTVKIGNQWWMAENLKVTHYTDGTAIPLVTDNTEWANLGDNNTDKAYCYYDNSNTNRDTYGALYTWAAAMNGASTSSANPSGIQGVCPTGWHLPSDDEWKELEMYLGMSQTEADDIDWRGTNEGSKLAGNASLWYDGELEDNVAFGTLGFTALPGGGRKYYNGLFDALGDYAHFWSATELNGTNDWVRRLDYNTSGVYRHSGSMSSGFSVRCLRDID